MGKVLDERIEGILNSKFFDKIERSVFGFLSRAGFTYRSGEEEFRPFNFQFRPNYLDIGKISLYQQGKYSVSIGPVQKGETAEYKLQPGILGIISGLSLRNLDVILEPKKTIIRGPRQKNYITRWPPIGEIILSTEPIIENGGNE